MNLSYSKEYYCDVCQYCTLYSKDYKKHLLTKKHLANMEGRENTKVLSCANCLKEFRTHSALWKHKKKCTIDDDDQVKEDKPVTDNKDEIIMKLIMQNAQLIEMMKNSMIVHNNNTTHNNQITNSNNKSFNLNFFLNETCKNAMNLSDFADTIKLQFSDFVNMGTVGFVKSISDTIIKNLNSLDETVRPIHCTDQKREIFYVKDQNVWEKDDEDNQKMKGLIGNVVYKNEKFIKTFKETYPDYNNPDSSRSDQYSKIMIEAMDCKPESREKIIRNICRATAIDKYK